MQWLEVCYTSGGRRGIVLFCDEQMLLVANEVNATYPSLTPCTCKCFVPYIEPNVFSVTLFLESHKRCCIFLQSLLWHVNAYTTTPHCS